MSVAHLDISYPSLEAFHADCEECKVNAEELLTSGVYEYLPDQWVVSMHYFEPEAFERRGMDVRPTAFESRLNIWRNSMETNECFTIYQCEAVAVIDDILPPYGPQATNPAEHELAVSDVLGMYLMGEEL